MAEGKVATGNKEMTSEGKRQEKRKDVVLLFGKRDFRLRARNKGDRNLQGGYSRRSTLQASDASLLSHRKKGLGSIKTFRNPM